MANLLSVQNLEKGFGSRTLFRSLNFGIDTKERIGLLGPNGAGKSTLLRILSGLDTADDGDIVRSRGVRVALLDQTPHFESGLSVEDAVLDGNDDPDAHSVAARWMAQLDLNRDEISGVSEVRNLSGGWQKRVALARCLVKSPDILLLDEPTNHLDIESILWLEEFLRDAPFSLMTVTHDRLFLQRVSNVIFDLDPRYPQGLLITRGTYADHVESKDLLLAGEQHRESVLKNTLRRETEWLRRGAKARLTKQQARIDRAHDLKDQTEAVTQRNRNLKAQIDFESHERNPQKLIEAKGIVKSYQGRKIFGPVDLLVTPKTRLALIGPNGAGKTTLIKTLLGLEKPDEGTVFLAERLNVSYFAQHRTEFNPETSVVKTICPEGDYVQFRDRPIVARAYLSRFLFRPEQLDMPVAKLSGGEKARLRIAQLMLKTANVLVLDEPTNDLDLDTLGILEESIREFEGAVILVAHDRYFIDQISNQIIAFHRNDEDETELTKFADYSQWEAWFDENSPRNKTKARQKSSDGNARGKTRMSFKEKHELETMEKVILEKESRLAEVQNALIDPKNVSNSIELAKLTTELSELESKIQTLYARWAELEAKK